LKWDKVDGIECLSKPLPGAFPTRVAVFEETNDFRIFDRNTDFKIAVENGKISVAQKTGFSFHRVLLVVLKLVAGRLGQARPEVGKKIGTVGNSSRSRR
jgi:hypothetical protein